MKGKRIVSSMLFLAMLVMALCGCSSYRGIYAAYEAAGYESAETEPYAEKITALAGEDYADVATAHLLVKGEQMALILEFHSEDEMTERIETRAALKELIGDPLRSDSVCGNCLLIDSTPAAFTIFRNSK